MNSLNHSDINQARLWAVARKEGLQRLRPGQGAPPRSNSLRGRTSAPAVGKHTSGVELELAARHFEDQCLDPAEAERLSEAILDTVNHGNMRTIGPVGRRNRQYQLCRQTDGLSVKAGEGRILLSLTGAVRLAGLLRASQGPAQAAYTRRESGSSSPRGA